MLYAGGSETKYLNSLQNEGVDIYIRNVVEVFLHNAKSTQNNDKAINPIKRTQGTGYIPSNASSEYMYTCLQTNEWEADIVKYDSKDLTSDWVITSVTIWNGIINPQNLSLAIIEVGDRECGVVQRVTEPSKSY